jgi:outer membrane murein-binding lipoprotein Lpp
MKKEAITPLALLLCVLPFAGCGTAELEEEISTLKEDNKTLKKEKADLETNLETAKTDLDASQTQATTIQTQLDEMATKLTAAQNSENDAINQAADAQIQMQEFRDKFDAANAKVQELEKQLAETKAAMPASNILNSGATAAPQPATSPAFPAQQPEAAAAAQVLTGLPGATPPVATPATIPVSPDNPLVNPDASSQSNLDISLFISAGGQNYPLPNTVIFITEQQPRIAKWGLHLKNPSISANELAAIQQSLAASTIHKKVTTDAAGKAMVSMLKAGTYWVSCANPATPTGLQWSVQTTLAPGANQLELTNTNRAP